VLFRVPFVQCDFFSVLLADFLCLHAFSVPVYSQIMCLITP
jgi:hypothetical protein